jgi:hypothetical protein
VISTNVSAFRGTITSEQFFERLDARFHELSKKLEHFLVSLESYRVTPVFATDSLNLKWQDSSGTTWNFGNLTSSGQVVCDYLSHRANAKGLIDLSQKYLRALADLVPGAYVKETPKTAGWYVRHNENYVTIEALLADQNREDGWIQAIADFQKAINESLGDN